MKIIIPLFLVVVSVLIFGWWGLLSLIIVVALIGWKDRHKGPFPVKQRWSICFSFNGDVKYELTHERAEVLLGFVMLLFYRHKKPKDGWVVHLVFNKKDIAVKLSGKHFLTEHKPERELYDFMESIDRNHSKLGSSSDDPVFFSRSPHKILLLTSQIRSFEEMMEEADETNPDETYFDKMREVFG